MAEPITKAGDLKPLSRDQLARFLPTHEAIIFMERLLRTLSGSIPLDVEFLYSHVAQVVSIDSDYTVPIGAYSVQADATLGEITVTLPLAVSSLEYNIGVAKKDTSTNKVIIVPTDSDLIVGETSQELICDGEVLNFISDGTNWLLAN